MFLPTRALGIFPCSEINKSWQAESAKMKQTLDYGNAAAQKMSTHGEADKTYAENVKRWDVVDKCIKEWIVKMEALI